MLVHTHALLLLTSELLTNFRNEEELKTYRWLVGSCLCGEPVSKNGLERGRRDRLPGLRDGEAL